MTQNVYGEAFVGVWDETNHVDYCLTCASERGADITDEDFMGDVGITRADASVTGIICQGCFGILR